MIQETSPTPVNDKYPNASVEFGLITGIISKKDCLERLLPALTKVGLSATVRYNDTAATATYKIDLKYKVLFEQATGITLPPITTTNSNSNLVGPVSSTKPAATVPPTTVNANNADEKEARLATFLAANPRATETIPTTVAPNNTNEKNTGITPPP